MLYYYLASNIMQILVPRELTQHGTSGESLVCCSCPENKLFFRDNQSIIIPSFLSLRSCTLLPYPCASREQTNAIKLEMIMLHF